jgi:hypothetical protein
MVTQIFQHRLQEAAPGALQKIATVQQRNLWNGPIGY